MSRELTGTVTWMGSQSSAVSISPESQDHWREDASPAVPSLCRQGFSGVSVSPCSAARDAPALGCLLATARPAARAALLMPARGTTGSGVGEGGLGSWTTIPTRPWHGCAQHTKGRVNLVPPLQLRGWKEEKRRHTQGWLPWASPSPTVLGEL